MYRSILSYLFLILIVLADAGCRRKSGNRLSEGRIIYKITYEDSKVGGYNTSMLPQELVLDFRSGMVRNSIEGGLGFFSLVNIQDLEKLKNTTYLRFIDKKYIFLGESNSPPCCTGILEYMQLEFTDQRKSILDLDCRQVIATFPDGQADPFEVWYTEAFKIDNPNGNSPFAEIPGIMLEFNTIMGNSNMHLVATEYQAIKVSQKEMRPPDNYRSVSRYEMEKILDALME